LCPLLLGLAPAPAAEAVEQRGEPGRQLRLQPHGAGDRATPKMISSQLLVLAELRYTGTSPMPAAPMSAYHGTPPTLIMISAMRLSDCSGG
jgi:hypothetical protein